MWRRSSPSGVLAEAAVRGYPYGHGVTVTHGDRALPSCAVWPDAGGRSAVLPFGSGVERGDVLEIEGASWIVTSGPDRHHSPLTGWEPGESVACAPAFATVTIDRLGDPVFNPATGRSEPSATPMWSGPAFAPLESGGDPRVIAAEAAVPTGRTILLPSDAVVAADDRVTVTASADPLMVDAVWWVSLVHTGPHPSERAVVVREVR